MNLRDVFRQVNPDIDRTAWLDMQPDDISAWYTCDNPTWLLLVVAKLLRREEVVGIACEIVGDLVVLPENEFGRLCQSAIDCARAWSRGYLRMEDVCTISAELGRNTFDPAGDVPHFVSMLPFYVNYEEVLKEIVDEINQPAEICFIIRDCVSFDDLARALAAL